MYTLFKNIYLKTIPLLSGFYLNKTYHIKFFNNLTKENSEVAQISYLLRHKVYCSELNFEQSNNYLSEKDNFDDFSIGSVISLKKDNIPIASMRLIIIKNNEIELPCLEAIKNNNINEYLKIKKELNSLKYGEISRLLILDEFRNNKTNKLKLNYLLLALYACVIALSKDLDCVIFMCENKMISLFKKIGVPFSYLSSSRLEHKGTRYPIKIDIKEVYKELKNNTTIINIIRIFTKNISKKLSKQLSK